MIQETDILAVQIFMVINKLFFEIAVRYRLLLSKSDHF